MSCTFWKVNNQKQWKSLNHQLLFLFVFYHFININTVNMPIKFNSIKKKNFFYLWKKFFYKVMKFHFVVFYISIDKRMKNLKQKKWKEKNWKMNLFFINAIFHWRFGLITWFSLYLLFLFEILLFNFFFTINFYSHKL